MHTTACRLKIRATALAQVSSSTTWLMRWSVNCTWQLATSDVRTMRILRSISRIGNLRISQGPPQERVEFIFVFRQLQ